MRQRISVLLLVITLLGLIVVPAAAQESEGPVVRAVLFFSPSCPHCHTVINEFLVPLLNERANEVQVIGIDISSPTGNALYQASTDYYQVPEQMQGVPRLVVGDRVLVGSVQIPQEFPVIMEEGLAAGGIDWPPIPGLAEAMAASEQAAAETEAAAAESPAASTPDPQPDPNATEPPEPETQATPTQAEPTATPQVVAIGGEGLPPDVAAGAPEGAGLAWAILGGMLLALLVAVVRLVPAAGTLLHPDRPLAKMARSWIIPVLAVVGLVVATYLAYVELTHTEAVCGPVGDCNVVQTSEYAQIAGIPVAVLGFLNYLAVLALWGAQFLSNERWAGLAARSLLLLTIFGLLFSVYLTLLELFVIRAVCAWCLTSAVITTALMLLVLIPLTARSAGTGAPSRQRPAPA